MCFREGVWDGQSAPRVGPAMADTGINRSQGGQAERREEKREKRERDNHQVEEGAFNSSDEETGSRKKKGELIQQVKGCLVIVDKTLGDGV